jgi:hypothetical protein
MAKIFHHQCSVHKQDIMIFIARIFTTNSGKSKRQLFRASFRIMKSNQLISLIPHYQIGFLVSQYSFLKTLTIWLLTICNRFICSVYGKFAKEVHSIFICIPKGFSHQLSFYEDCEFHLTQMLVRKVAIKYPESLRLLIIIFELKEKFNEYALKLGLFGL